jgi:hypothetical protein
VVEQGWSEVAFHPVPYSGLRRQVAWGYQHHFQLLGYLRTLPVVDFCPSIAGAVECLWVCQLGRDPVLVLDCVSVTPCSQLDVRTYV